MDKIKNFWRDLSLRKSIILYISVFAILAIALSSLTLNFIKDKLLSEQDVMKRAEEIQSEMSQANEIGSQFPTNQGDYDKAKSGIQNGEENYTEEELDLWE